MESKFIISPYNPETLVNKASEDLEYFFIYCTNLKDTSGYLPFCKKYITQITDPTPLGLLLKATVGDTPEENKSLCVRAIEAAKNDEQKFTAVAEMIVLTAKSNEMHRWYKVLVDANYNNNLHAAGQLGMLTERFGDQLGYAVSSPLLFAYELYLKAATGGVELAWYRLAWLVEHKYNELGKSREDALVESQNAYEKAVKHGIAIAYLNYGDFIQVHYEELKMTEKDSVSKRQELYEQACNKQLLAAFTALGELYESKYYYLGLSLEEGEKLAYDNYNIAANYGSEDAKQCLFQVKLKIDKREYQNKYK